MKKFVVARLLKVGDAEAEEYLFPPNVVQKAVDEVYEQVRKGLFFVYIREVDKKNVCSLLEVIGVVKSLTIQGGYLWADIEFVETDAYKSFEKVITALGLEDHLPDLFVSVGMGSTNDEDVVKDDYELMGACVRRVRPELFKKLMYEKVR